MRLIFRPKSEIQRFFPPKIRWSQKKKKKKKVFTEIETDFSAEIRNSKVFSAQNQVVSKKKHRNLGRFFGQIQIQTFEGGLFSYGGGGGYFQFFTKNRPQKHQKRAILHTSQANGESSSPPRPPPPLATLLGVGVEFCHLCGLLSPDYLSLKTAEFATGRTSYNNIININIR